MYSFVIDPAREHSPQTIRQPNFACRYAYMRSADSIATDELGQDYFALNSDQNVVAFALCDGVGQSFFGELAAKFLAEASVTWLQETTVQADEFADQFTTFLTNLVPAASEQVDNHPLPADIPPMLATVLEQKRQEGSQAIFVCGRLDFACTDYPDGRLFLAWMGDARLRFWHGSEERTALLGDRFRTAQRWSSRQGLVNGPLQTMVTSLAGVTRILAYSDGLPALDEEPTAPDDERLAQLIAAAMESPTSDDISLVDLLLDRPVPQQRQQLDTPSAISVDESGLIAWDPVPGASGYELEFDQDPLSRRQVTMAHIPWPAPAAESLNLRLRTLEGIQASSWTPPQTMHWNQAITPEPIAASSPERRAMPIRRLAAVAGALILLLSCLFLYQWNPGDIFSRPTSVAELPLTEEPEPTTAAPTVATTAPADTVAPITPVTISPTVAAAVEVTPSSAAPTEALPVTSTITATITITPPVPITSTVTSTVTLTATTPLTGTAQAETTPTAPPGTRLHTVQAGENLSCIAATHYGDAAYWPAIYQANLERGTMGPRPELVFVDTQLLIPELDGVPLLSPPVNACNQ